SEKPSREGILTDLSYAVKRTAFETQQPLPDFNILLAVKHDSFRVNAYGSYLIESRTYKYKEIAFSLSDLLGEHTAFDISFIVVCE
ncbi:MAG: hypothetical protein ACJA10_001243, partial [Oleispira sp.]